MDIYDMLIARALSGSGGGGGGGGDTLTLLGTQSFGHIVYTSATAGDTGITISVNDAGNYDGILIFTKAENDTSGYMGNVVCNLFACDTVTEEYAQSSRNKITANAILNFVKSSDGIKGNVSAYGLYPANQTLTGGVYSAKLFARVSSINTGGTIDNDYTATYYGLKLFEKYFE